MVLDSNEDYVSSEMEKQKRKLKDMAKLMDQQHQLLRLIVQVRSFIRKVDEKLLTKAHSRKWK